MGDFLIWQQIWNLGIPEMDEQHVELVRCLNRIAAAVRTRPGRGEAQGQDVEPLLDDLLAHARAHFQAEEELMRRLEDYPDFFIHHREHVMLTAELAQLISEVKQGRVALDLDTLYALKRWFVGHLVGADKDYAIYYHRKER